MSPVTQRSPSVAISRLLRSMALVMSLVFLTDLAYAVAAQERSEPSLEPEVVAEALARRGEILTRHNRRYSVEIVAANATQITARVEVESGAVEITFSRSDITSLRLTGSEYLPITTELFERGEVEKGLILLKAIYQQRAPLLDYLSTGDRLYFVDALEHFRKAGDPLTAVALAELLRPLVEAESAQYIMTRERILGFLDLGFYPEAEEEARAWMESQPIFPHSAMGAYALARSSLASERPETALDHTLRAVVFVQDNGADQLKDCYALAIELAGHLNDSTTANGLLEERQRRFGPNIEDNP